MRSILRFTTQFLYDPPEVRSGGAPELEAVAESVSQLTEAVTEMRNGLVDAETVERIAGEVLERQAAASRETQRRSGYTPSEDEVTETRQGLTGDFAQRAAQLHSRAARVVAPLARRDVEQVRDFQERCDNLVLLSAALGVNPRETRYYSEEFTPALRAMDTQTTAEGIEWVPRDLSANLIERVNLDLRVAALFPTVQMPTPTFDIPGRSPSRQRTGSHAEQTADTGQTKFKAITPATRKVTLVAKKFAGRALVSKEAEEDAIIALLPFLQEEIIDYMAADIEDTIINGDVAGTHMDSDVTASDDPRKNWDGLRKLCPAGAKTDGSAAAALTVAHLRGNRKAMGKYGVRPSDLVHLVSINGYIQLLADTSVLTMEKYGPSATILTGELGKADGIPLIVSEYVRADTNATGVFDNTTTTRQVALTVQRRGFAVGERRGMEVQVLKELYSESDQDAIVASCRKAFVGRFPSTEKVVSETYNVTS